MVGSCLNARFDLSTRKNNIFLEAEARVPEISCNEVEFRDGSTEIDS